MDKCPHFSEGDTLSLIGPDGSVRKWVKLSARTREFNKLYPFSEYSIRIQIMNAENMYGASVIGLYRSLIEAGGAEVAKAMVLPRPNNTGAMIPPLRVNERVIRAQLVDRAGRVIREASACDMVRSYKDHEKLESAAIGRLMAVAGLPGDELDLDERRDMEAQSLMALEAGESSAEPGGPPAPVAATPDGCGDKAATVTATQDNVDRMPKRVPKWSSQGPRPQMSADAATKRLIEQVARQYRAKGLPVPEMASIDDAREAMSALAAGGRPAASTAAAPEAPEVETDG